MYPDQSLIEHLLGGQADAISRSHAAALWAAEEAVLTVFDPGPHLGYVSGGRGSVSLVERFAAAAFAARLLGEPACASHYRGRLLALAPGLAALIEDEAARAEGAHFTPSSAARARLGAHLSAALEGVHRLVRHPHDAPDPAGWSADAAAALRDVVALVAFQAAVVAGVRLVRGGEMAARRAA